MYAIKVEDRYLVEVNYGSVKTSSKPKTYKDLGTAKKALDTMVEAANNYAEAYAGYAVKAETKIAALEKRLTKIKEALVELYDQPYREVYQRVQKLEKELTQKQTDIRVERPSISNWRRDATRMRAFVAKKPQIVVLGDRPLDSVDILDILKV